MNFLLKKTVAQRPVTILRDTACSQSLILSLVLPSGLQSDVSAVVRGIEMGFVPAPLHCIHIASSNATVFFTVGVCPDFPINGVVFIMGNDIAGGKVNPVPQVVNVTLSESPDDVACHQKLLVASALTRAQTHKQSKEVNLADSLLASVFPGYDPPSSDEVEGSGDTEPETPPETNLAVPPTREAFITAQRGDPSLARCWSSVVKRSQCSEKQLFFC